MKRIQVVVGGEVQGVGYREEIKRLAFDLNISGWVMNLEDGRVEIIAEGENKNIDEFLNKIKIKKYPIFVEEVKVNEEIYKGEFRSFKVIRDKDLQREILSALSRGTVDIHEVKEILLGVREDTSAIKQDTSYIPEIRENTYKMLDKQDSLLEVTDKGFKEVNDEMRKGFTGVKEEVHSLRDDFKHVFMAEVNELRGEIKELRQAITRIERGMARGVA